MGKIENRLDAAEPIKWLEEATALTKMSEMIGMEREEINNMLKRTIVAKAKAIVQEEMTEEEIKRAETIAERFDEEQTAQKMCKDIKGIKKAK